MKKWIIPVIITLLTVIAIGVFLSYYLHRNDQNDYRQVQRFYNSSTISADSIVQKIRNKNSYENFPYRLIAENISLSNIEKQQELLKYVQYSDSLIDNNFQELIFIALSDTLKKVYEQSIDLNDLNTLLSLTNEVSGLYPMTLANQKNKIFYQALFDYWLQRIIQNLEHIAQSHYWSKYTFEYKYISTVCEQYNYNPSTGLSSAEKVLDNFADNRYSYLFNRFVLQTTLLQKTILFIILTFVTSCVLFTIYTLLKSGKS